MMPALLIGTHLAAGIGLGLCYFRALWWSVRRRAGGAPALAAIMARVAMLVAILALVSREGALPLLATAAGVLAGRFVVMRQVRSLPA